MDKCEMFIEKIKEKYSDIIIKNYKKDTLGQNNDVIIINDNLVFRFPKYRQGIKTLKVETELVCRIKDYLSLKTPYPIYKNFKQEVGHAFTGYKMIHGEPLFKNIFFKIKDKQTVADQLASFLKEIHSIPTDMVSDLDIPIINNFNQWESFYKKVKEKLYIYMREDAKREVELIFDNFFKAKNNFTVQPTLVHGDFGPSNIIYDIDEQRVVGIIDFGSVKIDDPAIDFASMIGPFGYGESFIKKFKNIYPNIDILIERAKFYASTFALQEALFGLENEDDEAFRSGIKEYK